MRLCETALRCGERGGGGVDYHTCITKSQNCDTHAYIDTVEILIMHIVIMHNSHNALSFRGSLVGIRGKWVNIAYCIMHEVSRSIMHYEDTLYRG